MLREMQLDGTIYDKTAVAIERIKTMAAIAKGIYGGYTVMVSGGKDRSVITDLSIRTGVQCKFETSWTGIEHPQTVCFLRSEKERIEAAGYSFEFVIPRDRDGKQIAMWKLIEKYGFPSRQISNGLMTRCGSIYGNAAFRIIPSMITGINGWGVSAVL
jgi:3'-phosphoadenosine 5'-phosphosulfate sulfotransferase (PAPS reductase)/FAD synthetase